MECYLPCVRFRIRTEEVRHSQPNSLDLFVLKFLLKHQTELSDGCSLEELLEVFSFLGDTVLFGILYKLHLNFLTLTSRGSLLLNNEVVRVMQSTNPEGWPSALGCRMGIRKQTYNAYFDLYAGRVFLDQGYGTLTARDLQGKAALPVNFATLRFRNPEFFTIGDRLSIVNERLRRRSLPDGDFYEAERADIDFLGADEEPLRFLPILLGHGLVPHAGRDLPDDLLAAVATRMREEGRLAEAGALQAFLDTVHRDIAATQETDTTAGDESGAWLIRGGIADLGPWLHELIETSDWIVMSQEMIAVLASEFGTERTTGFLTQALRRGASTRVLAHSRPAPQDLHCLVSQAWAETRPWLPARLLALDGAPGDPSLLLPVSTLTEALVGGERRYKDACRHLRRAAAARPILYFTLKSGTPPLPPFVLTRDTFLLGRPGPGGGSQLTLERYGWTDGAAALVSGVIDGLMSESEPLEAAILPHEYRAIPSLRGVSRPASALPVVFSVADSPGSDPSALRLGSRYVRFTSPLDGRQ